MRSAALIAALLLAGTPAALAAEEPFDWPEALPWQNGPETPPLPQEDEAAPETADEEETVESLLARLAQAESGREARRIERRLQQLWSRSGSATADLLFRRSGEALREDKTDVARQLLEKLTEIVPDFAEGWHQRAALEVKTDNYEGAVIALRHTLALQPKHFGALAELGSIFETFGNERQALAAYREALAINPHIEGLPEHVSNLERAVQGQDI